jgi:hypothetical protein
MTETPDDAPRDEDRPPGRQRFDGLGDLLPETTRDETTTAWGDDEDADPDRHLRREVPPHHE